MLFDRKMIESPNCSFCEDHPETIYHLFIACRHVRPLWSNLEQMLEVSLNDQEKLLGCFSSMTNKKFDVISHVTILVKYYIHICRINKNTPCPKVLKRRIIYSQFIKSEIAKKKNKEELHDRKWNPFLECFSV